jgi:ATP-binding cassette subfamily B protein
VTKGERLVSDIRAAHDIDELVETPREPAPVANEGATVAGSISSIELSDVTCRYKEGADILSGVTGEFHAGRVYAVLGESGAGKSTLADVLLGLLPAASGEVRINGVPIPSLANQALRRRVVLVEQNTRIFTGSIRENILLGHAATEAELASAVRVSGLSQFASLVQGGLDFPLEYQGANLSGGQRQRVGIARAVVRQPDVLILDEATSALDQSVRDEVLDEVRKLMSGRILILITHDLHVASMADEVWQVQNGTILIKANR